jgi:Uma2 family endonuclease
MPLYAAAGIAWAWLVDPLEQTVEVFQDQAGSWLQRRVVGRDEVVSLPPFDAVELALAELWETGTKA